MNDRNTIAFTGELSIRRSEAAQAAIKAGFNVSDRVDTRTAYLVVGKERMVSEKKKRAEQHNVPLLTEEGFLELVNHEVTMARKALEALPDTSDFRAMFR